MADREGDGVVYLGPVVRTAVKNQTCAQWHLLSCALGRAPAQ